MTKDDFHAENIRIGNGEIFIDFVAPDTRINDIQLGVPVSINIENGAAATALAHLNGVTDEEIRQGMNSFRGVDRRFDFKIKNDQVVFLSDYAHHPSEIKQSVLSIRELYKDKKITAIFQPHLYTRTRDFYQDFADSLSLLDASHSGRHLSGPRDTDPRCHQQADIRQPPSGHRKKYVQKGRNTEHSER